MDTFSIVINPELKQSLAIFLFVCFAMYHFGYYAFYYSYDFHLESQWEEVIYSDNSLDAKEMLIEIPLSAPYMANQEEFQLTNTPYEKDGKFFRAIKQRYQNDTLQLVVVSDTAKEVLDNTVKNWISFLTDDKIPSDQNGKNVVKLVVKDYLKPECYLAENHFTVQAIEPIGLIFSPYKNPFFHLSTPPPQIA